MKSPSAKGLVIHLLLGIVFGVVLIQSEVVSWFRIYEMFRFQSPRMFLIIASAIVTAGVSLQVIRRFDVRDLSGDAIVIPPKRMERGARYAFGGLAFGLGWGLIGACPGPLFALVGAGATVMLVPLASALVGTALYGALRPRLPH